MDANPQTEITHVKRIGNRIVELGAMIGNNEIWRLPERGVIASYRAGWRYFMKLNGRAIEVSVANAGPLTDPHLRTLADKVCDRKLLALPDFPS